MKIVGLGASAGLAPMKEPAPLMKIAGLSVHGQSQPLPVWPLTQDWSLGGQG
jgi:hypothetical protein